MPHRLQGLNRPGKMLAREPGGEGWDEGDAPLPQGARTLVSPRVLVVTSMYDATPALNKAGYKLFRSQAASSTIKGQAPLTFLPGGLPL